MKNRLKQAPPGAVRDETILQPATDDSVRPKVCRHKREDVAGSGPHLTKETQAILQSRLRAAALMLLIGFGVFLIRHVVGDIMGEPMYPALLGFHVLVMLVLSSSAVALWRHTDVSLKNLRIAELVVFGFPAAFFLMLQHRATLEGAGRSGMPPPVPFWLLLIFTYGMFIPNTWRRAAVVIGTMAVAPSLLLAVMMLAYPYIADRVIIVGLTQNILVMLIAAVASVFGTRLINTLRREVFEAEQLGQYRLVKRLGAGGMGEVYLAEHRMLKRPCAIKLIHPDRAGDPRALARTEREVRMTARLSHWNTVEIFDYGRTDDGTFFYVMEYLPGLSLEHLLERHGPLPAERVVHLWVRRDLPGFTRGARRGRRDPPRYQARQRCAAQRGANSTTWSSSSTSAWSSRWARTARLACRKKAVSPALPCSCPPNSPAAWATSTPGVISTPWAPSRTPS